MNRSQIWPGIRGKYQRTVSSLLFRQTKDIHPGVPHISFTFDDFPRSALYRGGEILMRLGVRGTFYASLGLMGTESPSGTIFQPDELKDLLAQGHELGCHTFAHCDAWETSPEVFEQSIIKNKRALDGLLPGATFQSFSYPITGPRPATKRRVARHFVCSRGGGQTFNAGPTDLNLLKAFFLEKSRDKPDLVKDIIDRNRQAGGWLIFATHDISENPSRYGCTPSFFEEIVTYSLDSGAEILPVAKVLEKIRNV